MKTKVDVINETVEYYKTHPRSLSEKSCFYNGPGGEKCAFAFWVDKYERRNLMEGKDADTILEERGFDILKDKVQHIDDKRFWKDLQQFHDDSDLWRVNSNGGQYLTPDGKDVYEDLIKEYS